MWAKGCVSNSGAAPHVQCVNASQVDKGCVSDDGAAPHAQRVNASQVGKGCESDDGAAPHAQRVNASEVGKGCVSDDGAALCLRGCPGLPGRACARVTQDKQSGQGQGSNGRGVGDIPKHAPGVTSRGCVSIIACRAAPAFLKLCLAEEPLQPRSLETSRPPPGPQQHLPGPAGRRHAGKNDAPTRLGTPSQCQHRQWCGGLSTWVKSAKTKS